MVLPLIIGELFDRFGAGVFSQCILVFAAAMSCSFALLVTRPVYRIDVGNEKEGVMAADEGVGKGRQTHDGELQGLMSAG